MLAVHRPSSAVTDGDSVQVPMMIASFQKRFPSLSRDTTAASFHTHEVGPNQCCSAVIQEISAPISAVWSVVRRFDNPQAYKHFLKSCNVIGGDGGNVGSLRQVHVVSGLPAASSTERLDILDDERHVISFSVVGGDHRLSNYRIWKLGQFDGFITDSVNPWSCQPIRGEGDRISRMMEHIASIVSNNKRSTTMKFGIPPVSMDITFGIA
ncbi:hypothetical protein F2Q68_00001607 [Brassica cretica]|uniref:Uncharacterized protein n=1 Tax=Brassica cretica TaxID=69181 RepID=A0A8S9JIB1_BRACR|nr:hypothetical protein F2Q68_00001607 [Brassica cretica]